MRKTKLLLLTDTFPYGIGEKPFILPELSHLAENFDVTIISSATKEDRDRKELETTLPKGVDLLWYPEEVCRNDIITFIIPFLLYKGSWQEILAVIKSRKNIFSRLKAIFLFFVNAEKFRRWLARERIIGSENVICYFYWYVHRILSIILDHKKHPNVKIVTRAHGYDLYEERNAYCWQTYKRVMDPYIDKILFISRYGYDYYRERFTEGELESDKYIINYIGTFRQEQDERRKRNHPFLLVSCSNILPLKRIDLIVDALSLIETREIKWVHFGDGCDYDRLRNLAKKQLGKKSNIGYEFKGYVQNADIIRYYKNEHPDCFILTSMSEGSPVAMQEALSFGMLVIGTAVGGIPEMIEENGILLSASPSAQEVAKAIQDLYDLNEDAYQKKKECSLQIWNRDYDKERNIQELIQVLKQVSDGK